MANLRGHPMDDKSLSFVVSIQLLTALPTPRPAALRSMLSVPMVLARRFVSQTEVVALIHHGLPMELASHTSVIAMATSTSTRSLPMARPPREWSTPDPEIS